MISVLPQRIENRIRASSRRREGTARRRFAAIGLLLAAGLVHGAGGCGEGKQVPERRGELPYVDLDKAFQPLRRDFEAGDGRVRLVAILAPTCGECVDNVAAIDAQLLPAVPGDDFEAFLVWVCSSPPDVAAATRRFAERYADPRIRHYWDGSGRIARAFGRHVGLPDGAPVYDLFYLYGRADTWDPEGRMSREPADYNAILDDWQPAEPRWRAGKHPRLRLPVFDVHSLRGEILRLRAEP